MYHILLFNDSMTKSKRLGAERLPSNILGRPLVKLLFIRDYRVSKAKNGQPWTVSWASHTLVAKTFGGGGDGDGGGDGGSASGPPPAIIRSCIMCVVQACA